MPEIRFKRYRRDFVDDTGRIVAEVYENCNGSYTALVDDRSIGKYLTRDQAEAAVIRALPKAPDA